LRRSPDLVQPEDVLDLLTKAIADAGYSVGRDGVALALDPAASGFRHPDGTYAVGGEALSTTDMTERYRAIVARYPVWSIEDGLGEYNRLLDIERDCAGAPYGVQSGEQA
jgi:enolase